MGHWKNVKIDRSEGWKYQTTLGTNGDDYSARVYIDDNGEISKESYSLKYREENGMNDKPEKKGKNKSSKEGKEKEGCLTKLWKAPFRMIWWLIKKLLIIISLGMLSGWLNSSDDK